MKPEFSYPISLDSISVRGSEYEITAKKTECALLAERFGILEVVALTAKVRLQPIAGGALIRLTGTLDAQVIQSCGVTLQPVPARIKEDISMSFAPECDEDEDEIDLSLDEEDPPDPIVGGIIDIGDAVAEHLALALEPFPRAPGAEFQNAEFGDPRGKISEKNVEQAPVSPNPFAVLASLRKNQE